jgi:hypothetical protein
MDDNQFIAYCQTHSQTERALFNGHQVARLMRLAGDPYGNADQWEAHGDNWRSLDLSDVCRMARERQTDD